MYRFELNLTLSTPLFSLSITSIIYFDISIIGKIHEYTAHAALLLYCFGYSNVLRVIILNHYNIILDNMIAARSHSSLRDKTLRKWEW
jgi:hypothetical protein